MRVGVTSYNTPSSYSYIYTPQLTPRAIDPPHGIANVAQVLPIGSKRDAPPASLEKTYVSYLIKEIAATATLYRQAAGAVADAKPSRLETLYFGGGTPSLLSLDGLAAVMEAIDDAVGIPARQEGHAQDREQERKHEHEPEHEHDQQHPHREFPSPSRGLSPSTAVSEVTIEIDPGTFTSEKLKAYRALGVDRASVGVQSFTDSLLEASGRSHTADAAASALADLGDAGLGSWSIDLICGLPNQTMEMWDDSGRSKIPLSNQESARGH